jgi:hypothetical protein
MKRRRRSRRGVAARLPANSKVEVGLDSDDAVIMMILVICKSRE